MPAALHASRDSAREPLPSPLRPALDYIAAVALAERHEPRLSRRLELCRGSRACPRAEAALYLAEACAALMESGEVVLAFGSDLDTLQDIAARIAGPLRRGGLS